VVTASGVQAAEHDNQHCTQCPPAQWCSSAAACADTTPSEPFKWEGLAESVTYPVKVGAVPLGEAPTSACMGAVPDAACVGGQAASGGNKLRGERVLAAAAPGLGASATAES